MPGVRQGPEGSGEQGKMEKTDCKIICGATTTLAVKGLMMMNSDVVAREVLSCESNASFRSGYVVAAKLCADIAGSKSKFP